MSVKDAYSTQAARSVEAEDALLADGFEDALIGFGYRFSYGVAVYSRKRCIEGLMSDGIMEYDDATEYFDYNVIGAYVGENTPVFLDDEDDFELSE
jgi:hypothetical protein